MKAKANLYRTSVVAAVVVVALGVALFGVGLRTADTQTTPTYYKVQNLGAFPGGLNYELYSVPYGINDFGHVVGTSRYGPCSLGTGYCGYIDHAFLYRDGAMRDLGHLLGYGFNSYAYAINNSDQVVGVSGIPWSSWYAFLYEDGQMKNLGTLGGTFSEATAINESGQIVGRSDNSSDEQRAFLYEDGQMKDLGTLGGTFSAANAINESGQVVGVSANSRGEVHAFLYDSTNGMKDLGTLGGSRSMGGASSFATDISNSGQVVGWAYNSRGERHAFLYEDDEMKDLGTLGGTISEATAINESGQVVGSSGNRAFLYEDGEMIDLGTRLHQDSNGTVWDPRGAVGINNEGQIAVNGWRQNVDTFTQCAQCALLLTPTNDTEAPSPPAITSPQNNSYDTDGSFSVSGNAEASSTVELFEGATLKGKIKADSSSGAWSIALSGVSEGAHTYTAKATDAAGNTSSASNPVSVTVDKRAPKVDSVFPQEDATNVAPGVDVTATFTEGMQDASVKSSFKLYKKGTTTALTASVSYDAESRMATLDPFGTSTTLLTKGVTYKAVVSTGAKDLAGNSLDQNASLSGSQQKVWFFKIRN